MEQHDYEKVVEQLETIPQSLRDDTVNRLLRESRSRQQEIDGLKRQIRNASDANLHDLALRVDRILSLHPHDAQARRWAGQIRERLLKLAKRKLALREYTEALALVDAVPASESGDTVAKLRHQLAELDWCSSELRLAPFVSRSTLEVGKRLLAFDADNPQYRKVYEQLKSKPIDRALAPIPWSPSPPQTQLGPPVDLAPPPRRLQVSDAARSCMAQRAARMYVAAGLALHSTTDANLRTDLLSRDKGLLRKLGGSWPSRFARSGWGIDLSDTGVKAVHVTVDGSGNLTIDQAHYVPHAKDGPQCQSVMEREAVFEETLQKFVLESGIRPDAPVVTNWPAIRLLTRFLSIPAASGRRLKELIRYEAKHQIPFALEEVHWDCVLLQSADDSTQAPHEALLLACKSQNVEQHLAIFKRTGIRVTALQADSIALHNYFRYEAGEGDSPGPKPRTASTIIDIGHDTTNLVFSSPHSIWYRSLRWGAADLEKALVKQFRLTHSQARVLLQEPHRARRLSELHATLSPLYVQLLTHIQQAQAEYLTTRSGDEVSTIYCCGGGSLAIGLVRYLRHGR
jgi:type IV pilus assembly protein PilM